MARAFKPDEDSLLEALLDLDGELFLMDNGYWIKFEVHKVTPSPEIPHGISYSLTLHDRNNTRILGFDNAHAIKNRRKRYQGRKVTWDHEHNMQMVRPYEFESASQLIEDFWNAVDVLIK